MVKKSIVIGDHMLLVIDVGNTNIVFGVYKGKDLIYDWRISTDKEKTSDEYGILFTNLIKYSNVRVDEIEAIIVSSVVPTMMHTLESMIIRYFNRKPMIIGENVDTGINILYDNPNEVGQDRIVNAVAAYEKYGGPTIIVDFGTANTFCYVNEKGDYLGGVITPGIKISADALFSRAAKLPKVEIIKPEKIMSKNTINSMQAGLVYGYIGMVDFIIEKMIEENDVNKDEVNIIATGGFSRLIAPDSKYIQTVDKMLTLDGLRLIYERNKSK